MAEKSHALQSLGLELTSRSIKAAELCYKRGRPEISKLHYFLFQSPLKESTHKTLTPEQIACLDLSGSQLIVTAIDPSETLVRPLEIKLKKEKDIDAVLHFQAEPLLPYPPEEAILDKQIVCRNEDGSTQLTLFAIKKEHLQRHLNQWQEHSIEPEVVSTVPSALAAFSQYFLVPESSGCFVLHLGQEQTCCAFIKEGKLIASKSSPYSLNTLIQAFEIDCPSELTADAEQAFNELNWSAIHSAQLPTTAQKLKDFSVEIDKLIFSLVKQTKELQLPPLLSTGEGAIIKSLNDHLLKDFSGKQLTLSPEAAPAFTQEELQLHAIAIGAALTALPGYEDQVNFLQGEFAYAHPWRRLKKPLWIYFGLSLILAMSFYFFSQSYIELRENEVKAKYASLLTSMGKSHQEFEKELAAKLPPDDTDRRPGEIEELVNLSQDQLSLRISLLEKELKSIPDLFPLEPNIPTVSDVLAWLSTHPKVLGNNSSAPLIKLEAFNYSLIKRPEITKKQDKYQVKVDLEFSSANPTAAREFHDALLAPNQFIDPKAEVKWSTQKGRYKTTFLLKDKTIYP